MLENGLERDGEKMSRCDSCIFSMSESQCAWNTPHAMIICPFVTNSQENTLEERRLPFVNFNLKDPCKIHFYPTVFKQQSLICLDYGGRASIIINTFQFERMKIQYQEHLIDWGGNSLLETYNENINILITSPSSNTRTIAKMIYQLQLPFTKAKANKLSQQLLTTDFCSNQK